MTVPEALFLGHSHSYAILGAYDIAEWHRIGPIRLHRFFLMDADYVPTLSDTDDLNPKLLAAIKHTLETRPIKAAFFSVDGNAHTVFALANHPRPFDFVLTERPHLALTPGAEIVPEAFVRAALEERLRHTERTIRVLRSHLPVPVYFLESVPPVPSDEHIMQTTESVFWEVLKLRELGVAPRFFRLKLWRLHSELVSAICSRHDIQFVPVPPETADSEGFMVPSAWVPGDATHGNQWYGRYVLDQIAAALGATQSSIANTT
jgi:hypothetical protein